MLSNAVTWDKALDFSRQSPVTGQSGVIERLRVCSGSARAEDAQGTPTQSHISPSLLGYED